MRIRQATISALRIAAITALVNADVLALPPKSAVRVPPPMAPSTPCCSWCAVLRHAGSRVRWYSQSSNCAVDQDVLSLPAYVVLKNWMLLTLLLASRRERPTNSTGRTRSC